MLPIKIRQIALSVLKNFYFNFNLDKYYYYTIILLYNMHNIKLYYIMLSII